MMPQVKNLNRKNVQGRNQWLKGGKALPKFSDTLTLSQPRGGGANYAHPLTLPCLKKFRDYAPVVLSCLWQGNAHFPDVTCVVHTLTCLINVYLGRRNHEN